MDWGFIEIYYKRELYEIYDNYDDIEKKVTIVNLEMDTGDASHYVTKLFIGCEQ